MNVERGRSIAVTYLQKLHRSFYKSSMSSGLCTLNIKEKEMTQVTNFEKKIVRSYFNLKKNSHIIVPYLLLTGNGTNRSEHREGGTLTRKKAKGEFLDPKSG